MNFTKAQEKESEKMMARARRGGYLLDTAPNSARMKLWGRYIADRGVRNIPYFEELHSGITPSSKTGDYSDVKVVSPYGEIPWNELSRISDAEMHKLMMLVEDYITLTLRTYEGSRDNKMVSKVIRQSLFGEWGVSWNIPEEKWNEITKKH